MLVKMSILMHLDKTTEEFQPVRQEQTATEDT